MAGGKWRSRSEREGLGLARGWVGMGVCVQEVRRSVARRRVFLIDRDSRGRVWGSQFEVAIGEFGLALTPARSHARRAVICESEVVLACGRGRARCGGVGVLVVEGGKR